MAGRGVQVVELMPESHSYELNDDNLRNILLRDDVKDLPVVVVSVAGAFRGGKSFLLNFFLRYLEAPPESRQDGSWIGDNNASIPLTGFNWRGGRMRHTTGIVMWSKPIITTLASREQAAVILMDTQGTYDMSSTVRDCSTIFALSTLLSSVQIYNISQNIGGDDLQSLHLFTAYGRLLREQSEEKAFQALTFLVRDWRNSSEIPFGFSEQYLAEAFQTTPDTQRENRELREHISDSFTSVSCFLMPHPGLVIEDSNFDGKNEDIRPSFLRYVKELTTHLFAPENLVVKKINGQIVKAGDLYTYLTTYMRVFNSGEVPVPTTIMGAAVEAGLLTASDAARRVYETGMERDCGNTQPSLPEQDLRTLHDTNAANAVNAFNNRRNLGSAEQIAACLNNLQEDIRNRFQRFEELNVNKVQRARLAARELYDSRIGQVNGEQMLCLHPLDLEQVHREALQAAVELFDSRRRRISNAEDQERTRFIGDYERQYGLLVRTNEQNNNGAVSETSSEYWFTMSNRCNADIPISDNEILAQHIHAKEEALRRFANRRNHPATHEEDNFKANLIQIIENHFTLLRTVNQNRNSSILRAGVDAYDEYMRSAWNPCKVCLHPEELKSEHKNGVQRALAVFNRMAGRADTGNDTFNPTDENENALAEIILPRYNRLKVDNDFTNETAVQAAYDKYRLYMEERCAFSIHWFTGITYLWNVSSRHEYHQEGKEKAHVEFYRRRREHNDLPGDTFLEKLEEYMDHARRTTFAPSDEWEHWPTYETDLILG